MEEHDKTFRDMTVAVRELLAQIESLRANIAEEERARRARASTSLGMLWNGEKVHWRYQIESLLQDAEGFKRMQQLRVMIEIHLKLAAVLNEKRLRAGLKIMQTVRPVNEDVLALIVAADAK